MRMNDGRVVPNFIHQALTEKPLTVYGDGSHTRSFQFFSDLVNGVYLLLFSEENEPVNIGNPSELSVLDFAKAVIKQTGSTSEIVFVNPLDNRITDDPKVRRPDISKARKVLGWEPVVDLAEGLSMTIDYFRGRVT